MAYKHIPRANIKYETKSAMASAVRSVFQQIALHQQQGLERSKQAYSIIKDINIEELGSDALMKWQTEQIDGLKDYYFNAMRKSGGKLTTGELYMLQKLKTNFKKEQGKRLDMYETVKEEKKIMDKDQATGNPRYNAQKYAVNLDFYNKEGTLPYGSTLVDEKGEPIYNIANLAGVTSGYMKNILHKKMNTPMESIHLTKNVNGETYVKTEYKFDPEGDPKKNEAWAKGIWEGLIMGDGWYTWSLNKMFEMTTQKDPELMAEYMKENEGEENVVLKWGFDNFGYAINDKFDIGLPKWTKAGSADNRKNPLKSVNIVENVNSIYGDKGDAVVFGGSKQPLTLPAGLFKDSDRNDLSTYGLRPNDAVQFDYGQIMKGIVEGVARLPKAQDIEVSEEKYDELLNKGEDVDIITVKEINPATGEEENVDKYIHKQRLGMSKVAINVPYADIREELNNKYEGLDGVVEQYNLLQEREEKVGNWTRKDFEDHMKALKNPDAPESIETFNRLKAEGKFGEVPFKEEKQTKKKVVKFYDNETGKTLAIPIELVEKFKKQKPNAKQL